MAFLFVWFLDHTQRHTTVGRTPLDEWPARRRDLYLTTNNTPNRQTTMPPGGIRTHNLSMRAAADVRLRPHDHWDRLPSSSSCRCSNCESREGRFCAKTEEVWSVVLHRLTSIADTASATGPLVPLLLVCCLNTHNVDRWRRREWR